MVVFDLDCSGVAWNCELSGTKVVAQRRALRLRHRSHSGKILNPLSKPPHKLRGPRLIVTLSPQIHEHCRNALDFKSGIDGLCLVKAAKQQSSSKQQDHTHGNL